jgi:hypothetical protein
MMGQGFGQPQFNQQQTYNTSYQQPINSNNGFDFGLSSGQQIHGNDLFGAQPSGQQ